MTNRGPGDHSFSGSGRSRGLGLLVTLGLASVPIFLACGSDAGSPSTERDADIDVSSGDSDVPPSSTDAGSTSDEEQRGHDSGSQDSGSHDSATETDGAADADGGVLIDDPFDPASCAGTPITFDQARARIAPGKESAKLGTYKVWQRTRSCSTPTGCDRWGPMQEAIAAPIGGNLTGGFVLKGSAYVRRDGARLSVELRDDSVTEDFLSRNAFTSPTTSGPMTFPDSSMGYAYQVYYLLYTPPSPMVVSQGGPLSITVTNTCLRAITSISLAETSLFTNQFAAIVRF